MFNSIFDPIYGQAAQNAAANQLFSPLGGQIANQQNPYQANQQASAAHSRAMAHQQQALYNAMMNRQQAKWMINGRPMHFDEFVDTLCPDPEDPMRTLLTLKYKGIEQ